MVMDAATPTTAQADVIAFLGDPMTHGGQPVERIDTHGAIVFMAGDRAWKLKRAVRLPYLDFSTLERRRAACAAELALNRRTAPDLYLRTVPLLRRPDGGLTLDPAARQGEPADWVVEMRRFRDEDLFDRMAERRALTPALMRELAETIAGFHEEAEPRTDLGGAATMAGLVAGVLAELRRFPELFAASRVRLLEHLFGQELERHGAQLDRRRDAGYVRHCHGDLHLRNIVLWQGHPVPFDCLEFDEALAVTDVLYDLAFLLMDLEHRRLRPLANVLFNRYLELSGDLAGLALMPLFLALRAGIRAHAGATAAAAQQAPSVAEAMRADAAAHLTLALQVLTPPAPRLVAIGGLSGTGKSTLARWLAPEIGPAPGAVILRSDGLRKRLLGVDERTRLPPESYSEAVTGRVYAEIAGRAGLALESRHAVICDAVYARAEQRAAIEAIARAAGQPFAGLWLVADQETQLARVGERSGDASDATADVVRRQGAYDLGEMRWEIIPASGPPADVAAIARRLIVA
ncbi:conserved hypothetical protein [Rhodospirillum centenum SW]|uniref:Aminoglycoside phosphotransferase domain-containing protein n=2 Tax=Rhodospirillum centenum TaxID=34018 RepID=B6ITQ2_RHOCS|nr:conserved hypothetical protein [Rhodospirillum centenum SW]